MKLVNPQDSKERLGEMLMVRENFWIWKLKRYFHLDLIKNLVNDYIFIQFFRSYVTVCSRNIFYIFSSILRRKALWKD